MPRSACEYLKHSLDETEYLMKSSRGIGKERFLEDPTLRRAFVRSIEIIGEAAKQIPDSLRRQYPEVEWRSITDAYPVAVHLERVQLLAKTEDTTSGEWLTGPLPRLVDRLGCRPDSRFVFRPRLCHQTQPMKVGSPCPPVSCCPRGSHG